MNYLKNNKIIFHVDFDSYFVNASLVHFPSLKNKDIVISRKNDNSIITSASYSLKNIGIKAGMPLWMARKIKRDFIVIEPKLGLYSAYSAKIFEYVSKKYCKHMEVASIDEFYLDLTNKITNKIEALEFAKVLQNDILQTFKIPCTIGISFSKFYAKMTTNLIKPFNYKFVAYEDISDIFYDLDISEIHGVGKNTEAILREMGINKIGDLAKRKDFDIHIKEALGIVGWKLISEVKGYGNEQVASKAAEYKVIGNETSFSHQGCDDYWTLIDTLKQLTKKVCLRAQNRNLVGDSIVLINKKNHKKWTNKSVRLDEFTNDYEQIIQKAIGSFRKNYNGEALKGIGIRLCNLHNNSTIKKNISIFEANSVVNNNSKVISIIEDINNKMGERVLNTLEESSKDKTKHLPQKRFLLEDLD
ncbi:DNA polymerase IV [Mycoplasmopsis ciconiae]|uniref:DNA polymerase IV n=1 Tax=Mycoplasmopsis ciconiae TaxID=561067 RepID=A0ABU7MKD3_9BACT|nr:DNA polymerase IV [Mycoplasmopsis ciconiae]